VEPGVEVVEDFGKKRRSANCAAAMPTRGYVRTPSTNVFAVRGAIRFVEPRGGGEDNRNSETKTQRVNEAGRNIRTYV